MGGRAFSTAGPNGEPPLKTPRMSTEIYIHLKRLVYPVIAKHYANVACLTEAPGKRDHGDIDFLVQAPLSEDTSKLIAGELDAKRTITNGMDLSLAIPQPRDLVSALGSLREKDDRAPRDQDEEVLPLSKDHSATTPASSGATGDLAAPVEVNTLYAQVDIRCCPTYLSLDWNKYLHSYGDLGQILGYLAYEFGITSNDKGFFVRIKEQEKSNWAKSMIFLSCDPAQVTDFLGLNWTEYCAAFSTEADLFDWVRQARTARRPVKHTYDDSEDGQKVENEVHGIADHKRRMESRPMFSRFITNVLPALPVLDVDASTARKDMLNDAIAFFGVEKEYKQRLHVVQAENDDETARLLLVGLLTQLTGQRKEKINEIVRAIRHWVCLSQFPGTTSTLTESHAVNEGKSKHREPREPPIAETVDESNVDASSPSLSFCKDASLGSDQFNLGVLLGATKRELNDVAVAWIAANWSRLQELERTRIKAAKAKRKDLAADGLEH